MHHAAGVARRRLLIVSALITMSCAHSALCVLCTICTAAGPLQKWRDAVGEARKKERQPAARTEENAVLIVSNITLFVNIYL
jgi:hypothetical protein